MSKVFEIITQRITEKLEQGDILLFCYTIRRILTFQVVQFLGLGSFKGGKNSIVS